MPRQARAVGPRMSADAALLLLTVLPIALAVGDVLQGQLASGAPVDWRLVAGAVLSASLLALRELLRRAQAEAAALDRQEPPVPPETRVVRVPPRSAKLRKLITEVGGQENAVKALEAYRDFKLKDEPPEPAQRA